MKCHVVDDDNIRSAMKRCFNDNHYFLCPHTAVAAQYHYTTPCAVDLPRVCLATASPAKFDEALTSAGLEPQSGDLLRDLKARKRYSMEMRKGEDWQAMLRKSIEEVSEKRN